jgi:hypothetical protein
MPSYEALIWAQLAEEALVAASQMSDPGLKGALLVVAARYALMAAEAAAGSTVRNQTLSPKSHSSSNQTK